MLHRRGAALLALALLSGGCSGEGRDLPDADEFATGTCRQAAPAVLAIDEQINHALDDDADRGAVLARLETQQKRLQALRSKAGAVSGQLQEVITRVGFARAALATDSIGKPHVESVTAAIDDFVDACTPGTQ